MGKRLLLLITIPFLLFCFVILWGLWILTSRQMDANQENINKYVEESVKENLFAPRETLSYLNGLMDSPQYHPEEIQEVIDWSVSFNPLFLDLFILDGGGRVMFTSSRNSSALGTDYSLYNFYLEPENDLSLWTQPVISSATSTVSYVISLKRPDNMCFVGFYSFEGIQKLLEKLSTPSASIGILNDDLFLMAHTDYSLVEKRLQDQSIDFTRHLQVIRNEKKFHLVQWSRIEEYHVIVVLYGKLFTFYSPFLLTILSFVLLYGGLYLLISYYNRKQLDRLQQDLEELISVAEGINKGNYELKFKHFRFRELSRLAGSFNSMTGALKKSFNSLYQRNDQISRALDEKNRQYGKTREREEELRMILENIVSGIIFLDGNLSVLLISRTALARLSLSETEQIQGKPLLPYIPENLRNDFARQISRSLSDSEARMERQQWNRRILEIGTIPVRENSAIGRGIIISLRDITDEVEADAQLNQARRLESLGKLAGGVAHDFNNILQIFYGYIDMLREACDNDVCNESLDNMEAAADKGTNLVKQLLSFGRRKAEERTEFSLDSLIRENRILLEKLLGEEIRLRLQLNSPDSLISARRNDIERILVNLLVNARDAMENRGEATIRTGDVTDHGKNYVLLEVEDRGSGIDQAIVDKIFDPFFTTKEVGKGTGLGLSTVFGIVKDHGGELEVDSRLGQGTIFRILLPRR